MKPTTSSRSSSKASKARKRANGRTRPRAQVRMTLAEARERRALSQPDLADLAGVDSGTISRIEREVVKPYPQTRRKLATAMKMDVEEIAWPQ